MDNNGQTTTLDELEGLSNDASNNKDDKSTDNFDKQSSLFTKREWIMRYATPFKALMFMAGPMVIIQLVNSLYGIVDKQLALNFAVDNVLSMVIDGKITGYLHNNLSGTTPISIDHTSIGSIGNWNDNGLLFAKQLINVSTQYSNTIITLLSALSLLTAVGTSIQWGQAMGARDKQRMDSVLVNGLIQTLIISAAGILVLHFVAPYIITAQANISYSMHDTSLIFMLSNSYTQMFIWGFPLLALSAFLSTLLRTEGKVWWVIGINLASVILNVVFGEIFMNAAAPDKKMQAAVYGSFLAWSFAIIAILMVICFSKNTLLRPNFKHVQLKLKTAGQIWLNGLSPFLANFIFAVSNFVTTLLITTAHNGPEIRDAIVVTYEGGVTDTTYISPTLRVMSSAFPWMNILYAPIIGMMEGANANYSYCKGAQKRYRLVQIWRIHVLMSIVWGVFCLILIAVAGGPMMRAFDGPAELKWWFMAYVCGIVFAAISYSALSLFQGTGHPIDATITAVFRSLIFGVGFIVIGWAIARKTPDGTGDWAIFLLNGLSEIPATMVAFFFLYRLAKKEIARYAINDLPDDFKSPTLQDAAQNEVTMSTQASIKNLNRWLKGKNDKLDKETKEIEEQKSELIAWKNKELQTASQQTNPKEAEKAVLDSYEIKLDDIKAKTEKVNEKHKVLLAKYDLNKEQIYYKEKIKRIKVAEKYKFDVFTFGISPRDTAIKLLDQKEMKEIYKITVSINIATKEDDIKETVKAYNIRRQNLQEKMDKHDAKYEKIVSGEKKLTPWEVLFSPIEPQPLWALPANKEAEVKKKRWKQIKRTDKKVD